MTSKKKHTPSKRKSVSAKPSLGNLVIPVPTPMPAPPAKPLVQPFVMPTVQPKAQPSATIRPHASPMRKYILLIVLILMAISASFLLMKGFGSKKVHVEQKQAVPEVVQVQEPAQQPEDETKSVIERVRAHIAINTAENPAMWTISSLDLVKTQNPVLFKDAELGDYVLAWKDRIVVYSSSKDRIVGMQMIEPTQNEAESAATSTPSEESAHVAPVTIEIRNASGIAGGAKRLKAQLTDAGLTVEKIGDAAVKRTGTVIVDLTGGTAAETISAIQGTTGGTVVTEMPDGEPASTSGILVLIGR